MRWLAYSKVPYVLGAATALLVVSSVFMILPAPLSNKQSAYGGTFPGENGKIAFSSDRDRENNFEIYVMNADGSNPTRLTNNHVSDGFASWSPDGTKIAFHNSTRLGNNFEIYIMNAADGSGQTRLTNNPASDASPSWSPDGTKIAFASDRDDPPNYEIYIMNAADGSGQTRLTNNPAYDILPDWGPATERPPEEDNTPPVLTVPDDMVVEATNEQGARVNYTVAAEDDVDGNATLEEDGTQDDIGGDLDISCEPASGSTFPIGNTTVKCSATDEARNTENASFIVTVNAPQPPPEEDTTPPVLTVPENRVVKANSTAGAQVNYSVTAEDNTDGKATLEEDNSVTQDDVGGNITISCDPPSGSVFPIGDTEVQCSATDEAGNEGTESFTVTVNPPTPSPTPTLPTAKQIIDRLISTIQNLDDDDNVPESLKANLTSVLKQISNILTDDNPNNDNLACAKLSAFINQVNANERRDMLPTDEADELRTQAEDITDVLLLGC
jgi:hypothetical protein